LLPPGRLTPADRAGAGTLQRLPIGVEAPDEEAGLDHESARIVSNFQFVASESFEALARRDS
jgi:hypothetical protein